MLHINIPLHLLNLVVQIAHLSPQILQFLLHLLHLVLLFVVLLHDIVNELLLLST